MPYGLTDKEIKEMQTLFESNERIEQVILYGSRAKGNYKSFSDVDLTLVGSDLSRSDINWLLDSLDNSLLPYRFDISLFHSLKCKDLVDHIDRRGITIYIRK